MSHRWLTITTVIVVISCFAEEPVLGQKTRRAARASASSTGDLSAIEIARRTLPSVVLLECDNGKEASQGSGFFVGPGLIITGFHVINGMERGTARIAFKGRRSSTFRIDTVLAVDKESDLVLLGIAEAKKAGIPSLTLNSHGTIKVGETVYALGNPEGLTGTMSHGIISAGLRTFKSYALLQITAPVSHGSSGGPVVNSRGEVIGVVTTSLSEGQNLNFAVPASLVERLLNKWHKGLNQGLNLWGLVEPPEGALEGAWVWMAEEGP
jgi:S1-C subfamily serine protease